MEPKAIIITLGGLLLTISGALFAIYIIFERSPRLTGRTGSTLVETRYKAKKTFWGKGSHVTAKDVTLGYYTYKVNGKTYRKKNTEYFTKPKQMPYSIPIVYLKRFPRISYVNDHGIGTLAYLIPAILFAACAVSIIVGVFAA